MITELDLAKLAEDYGNNISQDQTEQGCAISGFIEGYKARDAVDQWISVEDNLPEEGDCVLCWLEYINDIFGHAYDTLCFHDGVFGIFDTDSYKVTHWQPLPSPPNQKLNH